MPENEARLRAIDADLLHIGVGEMLGQRAERRNGREHAAPDELPVVERIRCMSLVADLATDELVHPALVLDTHPRALAKRPLFGQSPLHPRAPTGFGVD